jgi:hypothetical protein
MDAPGATTLEMLTHVYRSPCFLSLAGAHPRPLPPASLTARVQTVTGRL